MAVELGLKKGADCHWDALSLGEIMLRLDPGEGRIRTTRHFAAWEGGGEYNVVRGLRKVFGMRTGAITALVDNEVGHLVEDFMMQGGVDTSLINWVANDGVGRTARNGLNFVERGYGVRGPVGGSGRGHPAGRPAHAAGRGHPTAATLRSARPRRPTGTLTRSSTSRAHAGCTPVVSMRRCRRPRRRPSSTSARPPSSPAR